MNFNQNQLRNEVYTGWVPYGSSIIYPQGNVGIGTNNPSYAIDIVDQTNSMMRLTEYNSTDGAIIRAYRAFGTVSAPTAVTADSTLTALRGFGYNGSAFSGRCISVELNAAETFTGSATGTYMAFQTCATGTTTNSEKMRILGNGNVGIGINNPSTTLQVNGTLSTNFFYLQTTSNTIANATPTNWWRIAQWTNSVNAKLYLTVHGAGMHQACTIKIVDNQFNGGTPTITISDYNSYAGEVQQMSQFRYVQGNGQAGPYYLEVLLLNNFYSTFNYSFNVYLTETDPTTATVYLFNPITLGSVPGGYAVNWTANCQPFSLTTPASSTPSLQVNYQGRILMPFQPAFRAYYGSSGTTDITTVQTLPYNATQVNIGSCYNTTTYKFTAPVAGRYIFGASTYCAADQSMWDITTTNLGVIARCEWRVLAASQGVNSIISTTTIVELSVGDAVWVTWSGNTVRMIGNPRYISFWGHLIG